MSPTAVGTRPRRLAAVFAVACAVLAAAILIVRGISAPASAGTSTAADGWRLPRLQGGGTVALADFHGRPLVVDFFATWCTACRDELPGLLGLSRRLSGEVVFAGVDSEENGDGMRMAQQFGITAWALARDVGGSQESGLRDALESVPGMPVTAVYGPDGRVRAVDLGAVTAAALASQLQRLFGVAAA